MCMCIFGVIGRLCGCINASRLQMQVCSRHVPTFRTETALSHLMLKKQDLLLDLIIDYENFVVISYVPTIKRSLSRDLMNVFVEIWLRGISKIFCKRQFDRKCELRWKMIVDFALHMHHNGSQLLTFVASLRITSWWGKILSLIFWYH